MVLTYEKEFPMRFQPGQSGNPAGRPPGSLNKKTLAAEAALEERAQEVLNGVMDRAKNGEPAAMRLVMDRLIPPRRHRAVAIELPVIKTPEDAELALSVVTDELAAGNLTISEASALVTLIERMLRLAERMWKFQQARLEAAAADGDAPQATAPAPQAAAKPAAPLYSPVNSQAERTGATAAPAGGASAAPTPRETAAPPLPRAA
jgi:Family of unknown function (DUF5681)